MLNMCNEQFTFTFTFTFMHLADAFIQSDLHCIQVTVSTIRQPWQKTMAFKYGVSIIVYFIWSDFLVSGKRIV